MDRIAKFLRKLNTKEKNAVEEIVSLVLKHNISRLDVKKLKGAENKFRVRKGSMRIIFKLENDDIKILSIERRSDNTYK